MDLAQESLRLRLDLLAVEVSQHFARAGIPHVLLKGPSTANWLYDPPRPYSDVDMLVPVSRAEAAVALLRAVGVAESVDGRVGEAASHSVLIRSPAGFQLDLHIALPTLQPDGDRIWNVLSAHVEPLDLGVGSVPALDLAGRCLVLALHALNPDASQAAVDLRRARASANVEIWQEAAKLAEQLNAADLFDAGLGMVGAGSGRAISPRAHLYATSAPSAAFGVQRLREARRRDVPRMLWHELIPSVGFMKHAYPEFADSRFGLARAHLRRWRRLLKQLPGTLRALRDAKTQRRG